MRLASVTKSYGDHVVLSELSWDLNKGEIVALIGPNGSGKSTLLRLMAGYDHVTRGVIEYQGRDVTHSRIHLRQEVGYLSDRPFVYPHLTADEFLGFVAKLRKLPPERTRAILDSFSIPHDALISDFSYGTARKVAIGSVIMHEPSVVVLDEPFNALDMLANRALQQMIAQLKAQGCSVVVATHYLPALEPIYDRVLLLRQTAKPIVLDRQSATSLEDTVAEYFGREVPCA